MTARFLILRIAEFEGLATAIAIMSGVCQTPDSIRCTWEIVVLRIWTCLDSHGVECMESMCLKMIQSLGVFEFLGFCSGYWEFGIGVKVHSTPNINHRSGVKPANIRL